MAESGNHRAGRQDDAFTAASRRRTTAAQRQEMKRRYVEEGEGLVAIGKAFGLSYTTVARTLRDLGVDLRRPGRQSSVDD